MMSPNILDHRGSAKGNCVRLFEDFKKDHKKVYSATEHALRLKNFCLNVKVQIAFHATQGTYVSLRVKHRVTTRYVMS